MNGSMPGGDIVGYNKGDTLTHEVGHWLELDYTHDSGCDGPGDYMGMAPESGTYARTRANEADMSFGCHVDLDTCDADGGKNPIHSFMSYGDVSPRCLPHVLYFSLLDAFIRQWLLMMSSFFFFVISRIIVLINLHLVRKSSFSKLGKYTAISWGTVSSSLLRRTDTVACFPGCHSRSQRKTPRQSPSEQRPQRISLRPLDATCPR